MVKWLVVKTFLYGSPLVHCFDNVNAAYDEYHGCVKDWDTRQSLSLHRLNPDNSTECYESNAK